MGGLFSLRWMSLLCLQTHIYWLNLNLTDAGNPCEAFAPHAIELVTTCLRRNRLGLNNASPTTPTKSMGGFVTPPTAYHTVQPFGSANSPESKDGGSAKRILQTSGKENWVVSTSRGNEGGALGSVGMGAIELEYR